MADGDLTTLAAVKAWLKQTKDVNDGLLTDLITAASDFIQGSVLQRVIAIADYTETRSGTGSDTMVLRVAPVVSVTSVTLPGAVLTTAAGINPATNGFLIDGPALRLIGYSFPYRQPVQIAYRAGYSTVPPAIAQACNELVGEAFERRDRIGQASKSLGNGEVISFSMDAMNKTTAKALMAYQSVAPV